MSGVQQSNDAPAVAPQARKPTSMPMAIATRVRGTEERINSVTRQVPLARGLRGDGLLRENIGSECGSKERKGFVCVKIEVPATTSQRHVNSDGGKENTGLKPSHQGQFCSGL